MTIEFMNILDAIRVRRERFRVNACAVRAVRRYSNLAMHRT
jgi:hypothetical protein